MSVRKNSQKITAISQVVGNSVTKQTGIVAQVHRRQGPIPTPEDMRGYKAVDPSLPNRIMAMAEKEQSSQYNLRNSIIVNRDHVNRRDFIADMFALGTCTFLCTCMIIAASVMFYFDKNGVGIFFTASAFITLPKTFLWPRKKK